MGTNRRNHYNLVFKTNKSRRFSFCYYLINDLQYINLVLKYLESKKYCQLNKKYHNIHIANLTNLSNYVCIIQKTFKHS